MSATTSPWSRARDASNDESSSNFLDFVSMRRMGSVFAHNLKVVVTTPHLFRVEEDELVHQDVLVHV